MPQLRVLAAAGHLADFLQARPHQLRRGLRHADDCSVELSLLLLALLLLEMLPEDHVEVLLNANGRNMSMSGVH
jgi:hypothetical protein